MNRPELRSTLFTEAPQRRSFERRLNWIGRTVAVVSALAVPFGQCAWAANSVVTVNTGSSNLTLPASYSPNGVPTVANDVEFTGPYSPAAFTLPASGTFGSLDDLSTTALTISNAGGTAASTLTLGGAGNLGNSVSGNSSDLLYVGTGSSLTFTGGSGVTSLGLVLGQSGNFDNLGVLNVGSVISDGGNAYAVTVTGTGVTTLSGANTFSGGLNIQQGAVVAGVSNVGTTSGAAGTGAITLGSSAGGNASLLANSFIVSNPVNLGSSAAGTLTVGNNGGATAAVFSGPVSLNGDNLTVSSFGTGSTTLSGGITGTGNLTITNGSTTASTTISTNLVNNVGTITNNGTGTGTTTISGGVGSNVTAITNSGVSSPLSITTNALAVNSGGTTLTNANTTAGALTVSGGITGTGNLTLNNNNSFANGIVISTTAISSTGTITNAGTGVTGNLVSTYQLSNIPGATIISSPITNSVTGIYQNSATSDMLLQANNSAYTNGITIAKGTLLVDNVANDLGAAANVITLGNSANNATLQYGGSLHGATGGNQTFANPISVGGSGTDSLASADYAVTFSGPVTLNNSLQIATINSGGSDVVLSGGVTGTGNITVSNDFANGGNYAQFTTLPVNNTGTITFNNAAVLGGAAGASGDTGTDLISGGVGSNVTAIYDYSNTNPLTISTSAFNVNSAGTTVSNTGAALFTVSAPVTGAGGLNINSAGASGFTGGNLPNIQFSGSNNYIGATTVQAGAAEFTQENALYGNNNALWKASNIIVQNGATLAFEVGNAGGFTNSDLSTIGSIGGSASTGFEAGSTLGIDTTGGNFTLTGGLTNSLMGLNKLGNNTLTLSGINTYTGPTTVTAGSLIISGSGQLGAGNYAGNMTFGTGTSFTYNSTASQTLSGVISGPASLTVQNGALTLTNAESYTGATTVSGGSLNIGGGGSTGSIIPGSALTLKGGALNYTVTTSGTQAFASTALNAGGSTVTAAAGDTVQLGTITRATGGTINVGGAGSVTTPNTNTNNILGGWATFGTGTGTVFAVSGQSATAPVTGLPSYDAALTAAGDTVTTHNDNLTSGLTLNAGTSPTINSLTIADTTNADTLALGANSLTFTTGGGLLYSGNQNYTISGTGAVGAGSTGEAIIQVSGTGNLTVSAPIGSTTATAASLTTGGSGTLTLTANNVFTGPISIGAGTLAIGTGGATTLDGGTYAGAIANSGTLNFNSSSTQTFSGVISGVGALVKNGSGLLDLTNANTFTGATVVNSGILEVGNASALKTTSSVTVNGTSLLGIQQATNESNLFAPGVVITGAGGITNEINNPNTVATMDRANTYTGQTTWAARGVFKAGIASAYDVNGNQISGAFGVNSAINFASAPATLIVGAGFDTQVGSLSGAPGNAGGVELEGATLTIGGDNTSKTYTGPISNNYLAGDDQNGNGSQTLAPGGNLVKIGSGTQVLAGGSSGTQADSYEGTTTIKGGVLSINSLGTSGYVLVATATTAATNTITVSSTNGLAVGMTLFDIRQNTTGTTITGISGNTVTLSHNTGANSTGLQSNIVFGFGSSIGLSGPAAANLVLDGGTLQYTGPTTSTDRLFTVGSTEAGGATGTLDASGSGPLNFTNTGSIAYGTTGQARTLALTGTNTGTNTLAPLIADNGAASVSLTKNGTGTWALTNANTYTGATTVTAGTLIVSGSLTGTRGVSVTSGTLQLAANNALNTAGHITLSGGTLQTLANQTQSNLSDLTLGSGSSTLSLGSTGSILNFLDSSANTWTGTLAISNWNGSSAGGGSDEIFIGNSADLTPQQLASITFVNGTEDGNAYTTEGAMQLPSGEIVALTAVPEPGTWGMILSGAGMLALLRRRRRTA